MEEVRYELCCVPREKNYCEREGFKVQFSHIRAKKLICFAQRKTYSNFCSVSFDKETINEYDCDCRQSNNSIV